MKNISNEKLNNRLTRTFSSNFKTLGMQYGIDKEPVGLKIFFENFKKEHNFKFQISNFTQLVCLSSKMLHTLVVLRTVSYRVNAVLNLT